MTSDEAIQRIVETDYSVRIQKLSRMTLLSDCHPILWDFLGLTREQVYTRTGKCPMVGDLPHDVWYCEVAPKSDRPKRAYGRSFVEAVENTIG